MKPLALLRKALQPELIRAACAELLTEMRSARTEETRQAIFRDISDLTVLRRILTERRPHSSKGKRRR